MAYNPYAYPYTPSMPGYSYNPMPPVMPQTASQTAQPLNNVPTGQETPKTQIQNGGFISVRTVEDARNYPIAPGNSITFKVENSPYLCTKTMGFSQLEQPRFEKFRLVREEEVETEQEKTEIKADYALKDDLKDINKKIKHLEERIQELEQTMEDDGV